MTRVLETIVACKHQELITWQAEPWGAPPRFSSRGLTFASVLSRPAGSPLRLLAEIKFRSPSAGALSTALSVEQRALAYARAGASVISVLTDQQFFGGDYAHLSRARAALSDAQLPTLLLAKEFILDARQLARARHHGADGALLIVRILDDDTLRSLVDAARACDLEPLVEVCSEAEVARAVQAGARVIGVNARDLDTLRIDAERAAHVAASIPAGICKVHLSGLRAPDDVGAIAKAGVDAALIGEALMRTDDPQPLLAAMMEAANT